MNFQRIKYLFIDRDGVINKRLVDDYVKDWREFEFLDGVLEAFALFHQYFERIFIVTNQQGVGKGLMTAADLTHIHHEMRQIIEKNDGRIDKIYACTDLKSQSPNCRKPNPSMGLRAQQDFPTIDFSQAVMFGDSISDMEFGFQLGMQTVLIETNKEAMEKSVSLPITWRYPSLNAFMKAYQQEFVLSNVKL